MQTTLKTWAKLKALTEYSCCVTENSIFSNIITNKYHVVTSSEIT